MAIRWRWPPERVAPRSPMTVSYPLGRLGDKLVGVGQLGGLADPSRVIHVAPGGDVFGDAHAKQEGVLRHQADQPPERVEIQPVWMSTPSIKIRPESGR